tara:strand:- start:120 stop:1220 length:1101 start_codon:yes stop_codon:yes gene_type:complete
MVGSRQLDTRIGKAQFRPVNTSESRVEADVVADNIRNSGKLARVIEGSDGYSVLVGPNRMPKKVQSERYDTSKQFKPKPRIMRLNNQNYYNSEKKKPKISASTEDKYRRIRRFSFIVGTVHLIAGLLMIFFANNEFVIGITSSFTAGPPGCASAEVDPCERFTITNFDARLAYWVAGFSLLSAFFHYLTVSPLFFESYVNNLERGRNPFRWIEYSLSSTLMVLIIMLLSGLTALTALIGVAFANISMILFGWISEIMNPPDRDKTDWTPFIFGCIAGLGAWAALYGSLFINLEQLGVDYSEIPSFVWFILITQFALFNVFALNHALQFVKGFYSGGYLDGERYYIWLSLISKSLLAWSIYINTLVL